MRWFKKPIPRDGENRRRQKFLWWPLTIGQETRWLERAVWLEVATHYRGHYSNPLWWWKPFRFVDVVKGESDE